MRDAAERDDPRLSRNVRQPNAMAPESKRMPQQILEGAERVETNKEERAGQHADTTDMTASRVQLLLQLIDHLLNGDGPSRCQILQIEADRMRVDGVEAEQRGGCIAVRQRIDTQTVSIAQPSPCLIRPPSTQGATVRVLARSLLALMSRHHGRRFQRSGNVVAGHGRRRQR